MSVALLPVRFLMTFLNLGGFHARVLRLRVRFWGHFQLIVVLRHYRLLVQHRDHRSIMARPNTTACREIRWILRELVFKSFSLFSFGMIRHDI